MDGKGNKSKNSRGNSPAFTAGPNKTVPVDSSDVSVLKGAPSGDAKSPENQLFHILSSVAESLMSEGSPARTKVEAVSATDEGRSLKAGQVLSGTPAVEDIVQASVPGEHPPSPRPITAGTPVGRTVELKGTEPEAEKQEDNRIEAVELNKPTMPEVAAVTPLPETITSIGTNDNTATVLEPQGIALGLAAVPRQAIPVQMPLFNEAVPEANAASLVAPSDLPVPEAALDADGSVVEIQNASIPVLEEVPPVLPSNPSLPIIGAITEGIVAQNITPVEIVSIPEAAASPADELPLQISAGIPQDILIPRAPPAAADLRGDEAGQSFVEAMQEAIQPQDALPDRLGEPSFGGPGFHIPEAESAPDPGVNADEEEEDIDILDVDEEEEAAVKQAMGVGRLSGEGYPEGGLREDEGEFVANGVERDVGLEEPQVDGLERGPMLTGDEDPAKEVLLHKRKMGEEHQSGMVLELDAVNRRTRQRTARPPPQKKKRQHGQEDDDTEADPSLSFDLDQLQAEALVGEGGEPPAAAAKLRRAKMASVSNVSPTDSPAMKAAKKKLDEANAVRFSIKQFTVPELTVAMPDTASISTLKRAAMDATMNLLGGGLKMRILLQGKRMQDEDTTLAQAGISKAALGSRASDALTFMLEPLPLGQFPPESDTDPLLVLSQPVAYPSPKWPSNGPSPGKGRARSRPSYPYPGGEAVGGGYYGDSSKGRSRGKGPLSPAGGVAGRDAPSPHTTRVAAAQALAAIRAQAEANQRNIKMEGEGGLGDDTLDAGSGAIILHPSVHSMPGEGSMAMVPHCKRSSSMAIVSSENRRRIRRPFTVSEVAALVEAVEQLGTGRCAAALTSAWWRDVKLRAFSQAKHRTYVDLKDKWKTLVHTAQIAPHQRRGEPVPQELLDRVVRAHAYWTEQLRQEQLERES